MRCGCCVFLRLQLLNITVQPPVREAAILNVKMPNREYSSGMQEQTTRLPFQSCSYRALCIREQVLELVKKISFSLDHK